MNKYLSLIFLYNRAAGKKIVLTAAIIPIGFLAVFLLRVGDPHKTNAYMLMERGFGGVCAFHLWPPISRCSSIILPSSLSFGE